MNNNINEEDKIKAQDTEKTSGQNSPGNSGEKQSFTSELLDYMEIFVFSVCAVLLIFTFACRLCRVDGSSMNNTLTDGEILIISDVGYTPKKHDVIVFHQTSDTYDKFNEPIVKRVIATPGEYVRIDFNEGLVYVSEDSNFTDDEIIDESSYAFFSGGSWNMSGVLEKYVPEGYLFVMGDNRNNSSDSRSAEIGLVDERRVLGKVILRVLPVSKAGTIQ